MCLATVLHIHTVKIECILQTRHPCNEELLAVRTPERDTEILIDSRIKISPNNLRLKAIASVRLHICLKAEIRNIDNTDLHLRVSLATLRITSLAERTADTEVGNLRTLRHRRSRSRM